MAGRGGPAPPFCRNGSLGYVGCSSFPFEMKVSSFVRPGPPSKAVAADSEHSPRRSPWQLPQTVRVECFGEEKGQETEGEMERPKSGSSALGVGASEAASKKRAKSWEGERGREMRSKAAVKAFDVREYGCREGRCEWCSPSDLGSGSSSGHRLPEDEGRMPAGLSRWGRSRSASLIGNRGVACGGDMTRRSGMFCREEDVCRVKRSLRLVGLELSDFGIYCDGRERRPGRKVRSQWPTFRTKVAGRSVSLEWLRESVRRAWAEEGLDESHRRLLARAAYEEWYFRKEEELRQKREGEKVMSAKAVGRLREEMERKKAKSEEEFDKWLQRKKAKRKEKQQSGGKGKEKHLRMFVKSKEEIEEAFLKWKKGKDSELEKRKRERRKEEEKKKDLEKQKAEKRAAAEKAFLLWKTKLEENERAEEEKRQRRKAREEEMERRRKGQERATSFQVWKEAKDHQIREKLTQMRRAERAAREERLAQMEERMYEADQAFEDWLEKVDSRKHFCSITAYQKPAPWIPG